MIDRDAAEKRYRETRVLCGSDEAAHNLKRDATEPPRKGALSDFVERMKEGGASPAMATSVASAPEKAYACACDPENGPPEDAADGCGKCGEGPIAPPQTAPQLWEQVRDLSLEKNAASEAALNLRAQLSELESDRNYYKGYCDPVTALVREARMIVEWANENCRSATGGDERRFRAFLDKTHGFASSGEERARGPDIMADNLRLRGVVEAQRKMCISLETERNEKAAMLTKAWSDIRDVTRRNDVLREEVERRALDREIALRELKEEREHLDQYRLGHLSSLAAIDDLQQELERARAAIAKLEGRG